MNELSAKEVDKLFSNYEVKLLGQMVKSLGKSIKEALSEGLESDPFLNSTLQRFMCQLYNRFGSFFAPLSIKLITSRHY